MATLSVLVADDHSIVREGLVQLIDRQTDMEVVEQAATGRQAISAAAESNPDVVVVDISMPDIGGVEATQCILRQRPQTRVIALSRHADLAYVRKILQVGGAGYVLKRSASDTLIAAIRKVARGDSYVEPALAGALLTHVSRRARDPAAEPRLSMREEDVLRSVAWGLTHKDIALEYGLSIKTVESYKSSAADKLKLRSRADVVRYAVARGWLSEDRAPER